VLEELGDIIDLPMRAAAVEELMNAGGAPRPLNVRNLCALPIEQGRLAYRKDGSSIDRQ
jgi:hypothetical protein